MATLAAPALGPRPMAKQQTAAPRLCGQAAALPASPWGCPAAASRPQRCWHAAAARRRRQPRRPAAASSSSNVPQLGFQAGGGVGGAGSSRNGGQPSGHRTLSDVIDWTINLPWQKAASWVVVAVVASQLRDFFGVSARGPREGSVPHDSWFAECGVLDLGCTAAAECVRRVHRLRGF